MKKDIIKKAVKYMVDPGYRMLIHLGREEYNGIPDEKYLSLLFKGRFGRRLDLEEPKSFNEKLQWLKLYYRDPMYTVMADKYRVREYIERAIGGEYLIPLLGVWDDAEDIPFDTLPDRFVLKCNHNSGKGMCICRDKRSLDIEKTKAELKEGLKEDYHLLWREWQYRDIPRRIICEEYLTDGTGSDELKDYKLFCFNGRVEFSYLCADRFKKGGLHLNVYDRNWEPMPFKTQYPSTDEPIPKPENYEKMIALAEKLAKGIPLIRVDFYESNGRLYIGELTLCPGGGFDIYEPEEWDYKLGDMLTLPEKRMK